MRQAVQEGELGFLRMVPSIWLRAKQTQAQVPRHVGRGLLDDRQRLAAADGKAEKQNQKGGERRLAKQVADG